jgi:type I restriction enzyme S subunit
MRWYGLGPFHRELKPAMRIAKKDHFVIRAGDVIYNKLFAWKGSFGIVPKLLDGMFVSDKFPTYTLDETRAAPEYLTWIFRWPPLWDQAQALSTGSAAISKLTLNPPKLLEIEIPLPPLTEQRRIVARIEEVATKIEEAQRLREQTSIEAEALADAMDTAFWELVDARSSSLAEVTRYLSRGRQAEQGESSHFLVKTQHVQSGRCLPTSLSLAPHVASRVSDDALLQPGDILIACSAAGCLGRVARWEETERRASTDTHVAIARPDQSVIESDYLYAYLKSAPGQRQLRSRERGDWKREKIGFRLTELNLRDLRSVPVPVPGLAEQRRIVGHVQTLERTLGSLRQLQRETAAELDAMLPAMLDRTFKGEL